MDEETEKTETEKTETESVNFNKMADEWLQFKKTQIKESTYLNYRYIVKKRLMPKLNGIKIEELMRYNYNALITELMDELSSKTVRDVAVILKGILRFSEVKYDKNFKISLIATPVIYKKEAEIFKDVERKKLEEYCIKNVNSKTIGIFICMYTGLRIGEICALKWKDINFNQRCIMVTHTVQRVYKGKDNTEVIYTNPKTQRSVRSIPISQTLYNYLKIQNKNKNGENFILTDNKDKYMEPMCFRYSYKQILEQCSIKYKKFHCLRHTFATRCIKVGMDVKSLSEILGHASVNVTLNIYVHSSTSTKRLFMDRL